MSESFFIGIDGGTQSTKVGIFDELGNLVAKSQCQLQPIVQKNSGVAYHPDDDLWTSLVSAVNAVLDIFPGNPEHIKAVGLCSIRCCRVIIDSNDNLAEPVISWMDERLAQAYVSMGEDDTLVTSTTGYLGLRLTGQRTDSAANYEGVWPLDKSTWNWSSSAADVEKCGLRKDQLSELKLPGELHGFLATSAAQEMNLPEGLPIVCTANDKAVEALGTGLHNSDATLLSLGTYVCGMQCSDDFIEDAKSYYSNLACVPEKYLLESAGVREGMRLMVWLKKFFDLNSDRQLDDLAAAVPVGCDGLATLPDWLPVPTEPHRKGATLGWQAHHTSGHLVRSVFEGLILSMHRNLTAMWRELGEEPSKILLSGGGAQSHVLIQMVADVFDKPCGVASDPNTVALGAAMCAAANVGETCVLTAANRMRANIDWHQPIVENAILYKNIQDEFYTHFQDDVEPSLRRFQSLTK